MDDIVLGPPTPSVCVVYMSVYSRRPEFEERRRMVQEKKSKECVGKYTRRGKNRKIRGTWYAFCDCNAGNARLAARNVTSWRFIASYIFPCVLGTYAWTSSTMKILSGGWWGEKKKKNTLVFFCGFFSIHIHSKGIFYNVYFTLFLPPHSSVLVSFSRKWNILIMKIKCSVN